MKASSLFLSVKMDSCYKDTTSENQQIHELDSLSRKLQEISESFHDMQGNAILLSLLKWFAEMNQRKKPRIR